MDAFLPGGQLERPLSWLGRARLPAHLRVLTATTPAAVLSPPRATRIRSRTACNRRAAPLPSIVGAGIEDPCAICPEICGVTRLEPYVATRRGGGRLAEGSSSHISWCVHCTVWFLYLHRCRSRGPAVQGATGSGRTVPNKLYPRVAIRVPSQPTPWVCTCAAATELDRFNRRERQKRADGASPPASPHAAALDGASLAPHAAPLATLAPLANRFAPQCPLRSLATVRRHCRRCCCCCCSIVAWGRGLD